MPASKKKKEAWHIQIPGGSTFCGPIKYVDFTYGQGVLCLEGLQIHRSDWVGTDEDGGLKQVAGLVMAEYARYFEVKGFKVEAMDAAKAKKLWGELRNSPDKFKPEEPAAEEETPAKADSKDAGDKEPSPQEEPAAEEAAAGDVPPHETKG